MTGVTFGQCLVDDQDQAMLLCNPGLSYSKIDRVDTIWPITGKSLSEPLILASTNPQYDKRLYIDLPVLTWKLQAQNMLCT